MGFRGSQTGELVFNDCVVPAENLLGEENRGVAVTMSGLDIERIYLSAGAVGIAERALDLCLDHANTRVQFGRPIAAFQMIQSKLADMYTSIEAMRTFTYKALMAARDLEMDEGGRGNIHKLAAAVALFGGQQLTKIVDDAVQIHGGTGLMWESEINRIYRSAKLYESTTRWMRSLPISTTMRGAPPHLQRAGMWSTRSVISPSSTGERPWRSPTVMPSQQTSPLRLETSTRT